MTFQDKTSEAVRDAERARLDEGLTAMGFPSSGGRRGGGFRLAAAVRDARSDRGFDFGEEWQRQRDAREAASANTHQPSRQTSYLRLAAPVPDRGGEDGGRTRPVAPAEPRANLPVPVEDNMSALLGYLERRDERIFGLIERLACGQAAPPPAPPKAEEPQAEPDADLADRLARIEATLAALVPAAPEPQTDAGDD
jgi:hypothetical protein